MTRVFRVKPNVREFAILLTDFSDEQARRWRQQTLGADWLEGRSIASQWVPPPVYVYDPRMKHGDVWSITDLVGGFALTGRGRELLDDALWSAELLVLPVEGEQFWVVNPLTIVDCIDSERSQFWPPEDGLPAVVKYPVLSSDRISTVPLFRLPRPHGFEIFCSEGVEPDHVGFRELVAERGVEGLVFEEMPLS